MQYRQPDTRDPEPKEPQYMKMVLYRANGQVEKGHEDYLEREAKKKADAWKARYLDPIETAKSKDPKAREERDVRVHIIVDKQHYEELYRPETSAISGRCLPKFFRPKHSDPIPPEGLDRRTLMRCSSYADDFFTFESTTTELHLPVRYPRIHDHGPENRTRQAVEKWINDYKGNMLPADIAGKRTYRLRYDDQLAFIREDEITEYIVPWIQEMEGVRNPGRMSVDKLPKIGIPEDLVNKIHLYNAMLQLGISSYFQRPLVDALILQMYQTDINRCHLDTLEMTVGRFYSRGVAILDPVINHFIGTYSLRSAGDRQNPLATDDTKVLEEPSDAEDALMKAADEDDAEDTRTEAEKAEAAAEELSRRYLPAGTKREWLTYSTVEAGRHDYPHDTISLPPRLEVLGHSIRHWSGVRRNGSTAAAHTGLPLNVGRVKKYYRRRATSPIRTYKDPDAFNYASYSTHRLSKVEHFHRYPPGSLPEEPADEQDPDGGANPAAEEVPEDGT